MMKKILFSILPLLLPALSYAADGGSSLSFAPPPSDVSVIFLGNIFGIVDGVLHGTGSQIMGNMFSVFNSAVLAIGGIIIAYTLIVSTMNTAQEGQLLGQKWSSIWIPMRSTLGLMLMIPKASGYCLMQIFVMWIVVQGVGAADKVWSAALGYLNRGGTIVQTNMNPATSLLSGGGKGEVATGAGRILAGQVCMWGLQSVLTNQRQAYLSSSKNGSGPCSGTPSPDMEKFCNNPVPDFSGSVNVVTRQSEKGLASSTYDLEMPNFAAGSPYAGLNGICGTIKWNAIEGLGGGKGMAQDLPSLSSGELQTAQLSRALAIQQMYMDLSTVAQVMVNNDPQLSTQNQNNSDNTNSSNNFSPVAVDQFGVPYLKTGSPCSTSSANCTQWGPAKISTSPPLFSGTEFQGAIADYNGIMLPTVNLLQAAKNNKNANNQRKFIQQANSQGWLLAGSYFFDLAWLNSASIKSADLTDSNTGLENTAFDISKLTTGFDNENCGLLCHWLQSNSLPLANIQKLIDGTNLDPNDTNGLSLPKFNSLDTLKLIDGFKSSTVYGFVNNGAMVTLPGQPGLTPPKFNMKVNIDINFGQYMLHDVSFPCGGVQIVFYTFCLGKLLGNIFYNLIIKNLFNFFLSMLAPVINAVIMSFVAAPLVGIAKIFQQGVAIIQQPTVNPIIALANMGVNYINFASDLWILLIGLAATSALFSVFIFPIIALTLPLLLSWLGIMVGIGFITAYYIPFLPYMIFTFGSIAWLMAVIEAMVAAPIVALGVTHPEGHDAFGKGDQAIMILMNVFLRPSMMIIGYIAAIALSYVAVWIINAGFAHAAVFIQGGDSGMQWNYNASSNMPSAKEWGEGTWNSMKNIVNAGGGVAGGGGVSTSANDFNSMNTGYSGWAGVYGFFFSLLMYTSMYLVVVQKAFTLITYLPDKVLRWISGGQAEGIGEQVSQWGEEAKGKVEGGGKDTSKAMATRDSQLTGYANKGIASIKGASDKGGSQITAGESTPS